MNKIIELLIEYDWWDYVKNWLSISEKIRFEDYDSLTYYKDMTYEIISKWYGFIKWLINNDKIKLPTSCAIDKNNDYIEREIKSDYESLLMLLAISNEPLEFLINILK